MRLLGARTLRCGTGKLDDEPGAPAFGRFDVDASVMRVNDLLRDEEPQPQASHRAAIAETLEAVENALAVFRGNALAMVANRQSHAAGYGVDAHVHGLS